MYNKESETDNNNGLTVLVKQVEINYNKSSDGSESETRNSTCNVK